MKVILCYVLPALLFFAASFADAQTCQFNGGGGAITFPSLDPSVASTQTGFVDLKVKCNPAGSTPTWQFSGNNGNAPLRLKHSSQNAFIPYSVAPSFLGSTGVNQNWRITVTILGSDYQNALVGNYSDVLHCTVLP